MLRKNVQSHKKFNSITTDKMLMNNFYLLRSHKILNDKNYALIVYQILLDNNSTITGAALPLSSPLF